MGYKKRNHNTNKQKDNKGSTRRKTKGRKYHTMNQVVRVSTLIPMTNGTPPKSTSMHRHLRWLLPLLTPPSRLLRPALAP